MISIDDFEKIVWEIYDEIPKEYFEKLNNGIIIEEEAHYHPEAKDKELVVLGLYKRDLTGKMIILYYGSFEEVYSYLDIDEIRVKIRETLRHELRHHIEFLAGNRDLEIEDENYIRQFRGNNE